MLKVEKLEHSFSYTLEVLTEDGSREQTVDLVETFNWLYGLRVNRLLTWEAKQGKEARKYRVVVATDRDNRKRILVVWRDMTGLEPRAERASWKPRSPSWATLRRSGSTATAPYPASRRWMACSSD